MKAAIVYARRLTSTSVRLQLGVSANVNLSSSAQHKNAENSCYGILTTKSMQIRPSCRSFTSTGEGSTSKSKRGTFFKKMKESKENQSNLEGDSTTEGKGTKALNKDMNVLALSKLHHFSNETEFNEVLENTFHNLHEVMNDLKGVNPGMVIDKTNDGIQIKVDDTLFSVSGGDYKLMFMSPESGVRLYVLSSEAKRWVGEKDGHDFEGLFTRDFMRHAYGIPEFKR